MLSPDDIQAIAVKFVDPLDTYQRWCIHTGGLAFTTYEEELEAQYGEANLPALKTAIYAEILQQEGGKN